LLNFIFWEILTEKLHYFQLMRKISNELIWGCFDMLGKQVVLGLSCLAVGSALFGGESCTFKLSDSPMFRGNSEPDFQIVNTYKWEGKLAKGTEIVCSQPGKPSESVKINSVIHDNFSKAPKFLKCNGINYDGSTFDACVKKVFGDPENLSVKDKNALVIAYEAFTLSLHPQDFGFIKDVASVTKYNIGEATQMGTAGITVYRDGNGLVLAKILSGGPYALPMSCQELP
jgi:hypothetical protein